MPVVKEQFYFVAESDLRHVQGVMTRLHSERRMDGNEMRDLGHTLESFLRVTREQTIPDEPQRD